MELIVSWIPATSSIAISRNPTASTYHGRNHGSPSTRFWRPQSHSNAHAASSRNDEYQVGRLFSSSTSKSCLSSHGSSSTR
jgi:hypothetical protein